MKINSKTYKKHLERELLFEINHIMNCNTWLIIKLVKHHIVPTLLKKNWAKRLLSTQNGLHHPQIVILLNPRLLSSWVPLLEQNKRKSVWRPIQLTFGNSNGLKRKIKKVWPEAAHDLTEIRKALKQFIPRLKAV